MRDGYLTLTDKEKETLRLLVSGYDAKTMARHLGLSVHTINERLRDARRKMATSSSREAARLLHELESQTPELLGDKGLGDAQIAPAAPQDQSPTTAIGARRRLALMTGGLIMSLALALYALSTLTGGGTTPVAAPTTSAATTSQAAAVAAANQWLALVDASNWQASYDATAKSFRSVNTAERWADASKQVRVPLGAAKSRALVTADFAPAPPDGYWVVKFRTDFAGKAGAVETLALVWENDGWQVVGYIID